MSIVTRCYLDVLDSLGTAVQEVFVSGPSRIGRTAPESEVDITIPSECRSASRLHAVIEPHEGHVRLTDQSRFGTIVNGTVVLHDSVVLRHGDELVFGLPHDGWRVRLRIAGAAGATTAPADPLESLVVSETPRQVRIGRLVVEEQLGARPFRLLKFLADHKGAWYGISSLVDILWPDPETAPYQAHQALSHYKKSVNDVLRPHLHGQDAIESWPHRGYRMRQRLEGE